jgi:dinuclear metal center YbgI/SA1388 family protein
MRIKDVADIIESFAPKELQENYDNSGLQLGNPNLDVTGIICTIDITLEVVKEAIQKKANLIVSHHPLIFQSIKSITGKNSIEEIIIECIQNNIAIYASHTNMDSVSEGVNSQICKKVGLKNCRILVPIEEKLLKLVTYVPVQSADSVRNAIFQAGAGVIGNYDNCSFNMEGYGTFKGNSESNPFLKKRRTTY